VLTIMADFIPKKSLGQHWLHDTATLDAIVEGAGVRAGDAILEIGPGLGTLTKRLLARGAHVTAVEFDQTLADQLSKNVLEDGPIDSKEASNRGDLTVVQSDILRFDLTTLPAGFKVVANIPYYLTSNLIRVLCESSNPFSAAAILIQKEVAERVVAQPGQMSMLSVSAQYYCQASLGVKVPAALFTPPPKVDSQVLVLHRRTEPLFKGVDTKQFFRLVKAGFSQKRKTLLNSLSAGLGLSKGQTRTMLAVAGVAENTRAQALSLNDWYTLYTVVYQSA